VVLVVVLVVALKPGNITVKGTMQDCTGLTSAGDQVTVTSASGTVLATGTLSDDNSKAAAQLEKTYDSLQLSLGSLSGGSDQSMSVYDFTLTVPGGQPRYGLNAGHGGTVWFTPDEMSKGPGLTLGCSQ
jgi:hypothetical protein